MDSDRVIYVSTFSKSLMPSLRIGYMVLPRLLLERYQTEFPYYTCSVSRFDQTILTRFMKEGDFEKHLNRMRKIYRRKLDVVVHALRDIPFLRLTGESAGLHVVLSVSNGMSEQELLQRAKDASIQVYGLSDYAQLPLSTIHPQIVLGFASVTEQHLEQGLAELVAAWQLQ
jgi:GntR family transcriptional regulator/MocR family aminotransferase